MSMQISFLLIYKKYFLLAILLYQQKMHKKTPQSLLFMQNNFTLVVDYNFTLLHINKMYEKTPQFILFILTHFHQKINYFIPLKDSCCPHILLFLFPYLSPSIYPSKHLKSPILQGLEKNNKKRTRKEEDIFILIRKIIRKRPDGCVNTPYHKPYNNTETCINTGFNQNCCHYFLSNDKRTILFLSLFSPLSFSKSAKNPNSIGV